MNTYIKPWERLFSPFKIFGNYMKQNNTAEKYQELLNGNDKAFVDPNEWQPFNLWCIENLKKYAIHRWNMSHLYGL